MNPTIKTNEHCSVNKLCSKTCASYRNGHNSFLWPVLVVDSIVSDFSKDTTDVIYVCRSTHQRPKILKYKS